MNRLPGLDLLRALAIVIVMLYHVTSWGPVLPRFVEFGYIGVDLFFVLSGFLIGRQLLQPYAAGAQPAWGQFFLRRAFRVLPAYWVVLALYVTLPALRENPGMQPPWHFLTFTQNLLADYSVARAFSHAWSLCVEEHFYLMLPLVVWWVARKPSATKVAAIAVSIVVGGMLLRGWLWLHPGQGDLVEYYVENIYNPTYCRLDGLLVGVTLALVNVFRPKWWAWAMARGMWFLLAGALAVVAALSLKPLSLAGAVAGFPLLSAGLGAIVLAAISPDTWLGRWRVPGAAPIAAMAFSLYLTHKPVYYLVHTHLDASLPVYLGAALLAGAVLHLAVERPGIRLRERFSAPEMKKGFRAEAGNPF